MQNSRTAFRPLYLSLLLLSTITLTTLTQPARSEEVKIEVTAADALRAALEKMVGKNVALRLHSGEEIGGTLEAVGPDAVRLGQLTGKEFYSAVIRIEGIDSVIYRNK